jgi:predicted acylesterase/phospholipase RssA
MSQPAAQGGGKTAFVLSGGGSLGAIQVGMLHALMEAGIRPDLLVGPSVGAVNAAWLAGLPDVQGALKLAEIWSGLRRRHIFPLNPWSGALGLVGRTTHVISNAGLRSVLEKNLPYTRLEQAAIPVHVLTTDLRFVERRLEAEVRAHRDVAEIHMLPTIDAIAVSPADFSRTPELIRLAHRYTRRFLAGTARPPAVKPAAIKLAGLAVRAA